MRVEPGVWVKLRYRVFDSQGEPLEPVSRTLEFVFGQDDTLLPKIAQLLEGSALGEQRTAYLQPEDAFGDYDAQWVRLATLATLPEGTEIGMGFEGFPGEPGDGRVYTVTDVAGDTVVLDGNHPLAGMALRFEIEVLELGEVPGADDDKGSGDAALG